MAKALPGRRSLKKRSFPRIAIAVVVVAIAAVSITILSFGVNNSSNNVQASSKVSNQKRYKATRAIVVDPQTGKLRLPTQEEINQTIASLKVLANRPENLPQAATASGAVASDLEGGYNGVMLARPNSDGTWETKCVFTLEEGTDFLGLIEVNFKE